MRLSDLGATFVCLVLAAGLARAQVFIVDATGGTGAHFTDLPTAVAAVPDGAKLRVRAGLYAGFTLTGKGLSIVGEGTVVVSMPQPLVISWVGARQRMLLKGLVLGDPFLAPVIEFVDSAGPIVVDSCTFAGPGGSATAQLRVIRCANVALHDATFLGSTAGSYIAPLPRVEVADSAIQLSRCDVSGNSGPTPIGQLCFVSHGMPALRAQRSRIVAVRSSFRGGWGSLGRDNFRPFGCVVPSQDGGAGIELIASTLIALGSEIAGRNGHDEFLDFNGLVRASNGGDALQLRGASAIVMGGAVLPGSGGNPNGLPGRTVWADQFSSFLARPFALPTAGHIEGIQERGQVIQFVARAAPASPLVLLLSYRAELVPIEPVAFGSLLAFPAAVLGPFVVPSTGDFRGPFSLPVTWPLGETYFGQFVSLEPGPNTVWVSNSFPLHVNH